MGSYARVQARTMGWPSRRRSPPWSPRASRCFVCVQRWVDGAASVRQGSAATAGKQRNCSARSRPRGHGESSESGSIAPVDSARIFGGALLPLTGGVVELGRRGAQDLIADEALGLVHVVDAVDEPVPDERTANDGALNARGTDCCGAVRRASREDGWRRTRSRWRGPCSPGWRS